MKVHNTPRKEVVICTSMSLATWSMGPTLSGTFDADEEFACRAGRGHGGGRDEFEAVYFTNLKDELECYVPETSIPVISTRRRLYRRICCTCTMLCLAIAALVCTLTLLDVIPPRSSNNETTMGATYVHNSSSPGEVLQEHVEDPSIVATTSETTEGENGGGGGEEVLKNQQGGDGVQTQPNGTTSALDPMDVLNETSESSDGEVVPEDYTLLSTRAGRAPHFDTSTPEQHENGTKDQASRTEPQQHQQKEQQEKERQQKGETSTRAKRPKVLDMTGLPMWTPDLKDTWPELNGMNARDAKAVIEQETQGRVAVIIVHDDKDSAEKDDKKKYSRDSSTGHYNSVTIRNKRRKDKHHVAVREDRVRLHVDKNENVSKTPRLG